ncbi:tumor necrosis factor receptor superfamily member 19 isoform X5 [Felis catus]|uniref:tumor necrosis factor receptor superfamily member 19 isoform X5 n=1 Tax=Felis catus TaxID=9685 RepID=UPI000C2F9DEC|nr:tumor necrosis factor receptor superfamily member 19 isoform X5 [Felis catus]
MVANCSSDVGGIHKTLQQKGAMTFKAHLGQERAFRTVVVLLAYLACRVICETGDCRQQEYRDGSGNCVLCKQCGPGMELSKECGFGYGEDARCLTCRPHRFKEDWGFQKCKPCLECAVVNRFQKANCSVTSDAVCGDCLPGFYRKTKLVGFQDMECVPCGDPPPPYEPHWPVHLIPSLCCDEACSIDRVTLGCRVHSKTTLQERHAGPVGETMPTFFGSLSRSICGEFSDAWPLMQSPVCGDDISFCDSDPELAGEDVHPLGPENHCSFSSDSDSRQDSVGGAVPIQARPENLTDAADFSRPHSSPTESVLTQATLPARRQLHQESGDMIGLTAQTSLQEKNTDGTQQALTPPLGLMD